MLTHGEPQELIAGAVGESEAVDERVVVDAFDGLEGHSFPCSGVEEGGVWICRYTGGLRRRAFETT